MPTDRAQLRKASEVYAQALLDAATAEDTVFEVGGQLIEVLQAIRGSIELREALSDRALPAAVRTEIATEVFAGRDAALLAVLGVMIEREDLDLLNKVSEGYIERSEAALNAVIIDVTTAVGLDDSLRAAICAKYSAQFGAQVLLREHVDPAIVGGVILSAHGKRIDASIVSQLERARVTLTNNR